MENDTGSVEHWFAELRWSQPGDGAKELVDKLGVECADDLVHIDSADRAALAIQAGFKKVQTTKFLKFFGDPLPGPDYRRYLELTGCGQDPRCCQPQLLLPRYQLRTPLLPNLKQRQQLGQQQLTHCQRLVPSVCLHHCPVCIVPLSRSVQCQRHRVYCQNLGDSLPSMLLVATRYIVCPSR